LELGRKGRPTRGIDGGRQWLRRRLGENDEKGDGLVNMRTGEVYWGLGKPVEWSAGGERERVHELKAAAAMAGGAAGLACGGEKGRLL
jgi:hypothetical protein